MESGMIRDTLPDSVQRARASQGRITGPTRRSTKGQWTPEEDEILRMAVQRFKGKNWKKIAELIKDRTDVQCLHRWQKVLNPDLVKGPWSKEEDEIIVELVNKYGPKKWSTIAQHLPGRIGKQCRERWHNHLNPGINKEAWTQDEELALIRAHQIYGNKWAELTKFLPGRSDNAIKNHWNSSLKKKLDMYLASGLLSQFQGSSIASLSNHSVASSTSKPHKSSEDDMVRTEIEEASECSQSSYVPSFSQETPYVTPEEPCGPGDNSLEHTFFLDWSELGTDELPDMSLLDIGQESSGQFMQSSNGGDNDEPIPNGYIELGDYTSMVNMVVCADGPNLIAVNNGCPSVDVISDFDGQQDSLLNSGLYHQMPLLTQDQYNCLPHVNADCESILPTTPDASNAKKVPANNFVLVTLSDSRCCSPNDKIPVKSGEWEGSRALFYEPPRYPSSDIPFLSCDLVQSDVDMHQEFSPFGIRQLTNSFKLWDSPSRNEDTSPMAILKCAAKSFTGTPSILKKRQRDLLSPLSEKRGEKKLLGSSEEFISYLRNDTCRLEVMFNECADGKGAVLPLSPDGGGNLNCTEKNNVHPACEISERIISRKECYVGECSEKMIERAEIKTETETMGNNAMNTDKDSSGILIEHDTNDLLFFSPDCFGIKGDGSFGANVRAVLSPSEVSYFSVICSPSLRMKKDGSNNLFTTTSLQSPSPSENKVKSSGKVRNLENNGICMETPLKRSIETPSPWKSPWFVNAFVPGPRVDTDLTIEDFGYYLSPGDHSYDAIGLMKQVGEQTAGALANAHKILGDETPETLLKGKYTMNKEDEKENLHSPNSHKEQLRSTSIIMTERRALDFSGCETPVKESGNTSNNISFSSPSSYLLKACR